MKTLVLGFGHPARGDDAAGLAVVEILDSPDAVPVSGDPLSAIDCWAGYDRVILVDAMRSGRPPGSTVRAGSADLPEGVTYFSTHAFGPVELIRLARALTRLPPQLELIGIEADEVSVGAPMSEAVSQAVLALAKELSCMSQV